jgi:hypothetical protein
MEDTTTNGGNKNADDDAAETQFDHFPGDSVKVIAQTVGIENLSDEVARALAPDVVGGGVHSCRMHLDP